MKRIQTCFRLAQIAAVICSLTACTTQRLGLPELDPESTPQVLAIGHFRSGTHLPARPSCGQSTVDDDGNQTITICFDPAPLRFVFEVDEVIAGELDLHRITAYTTHHWGLDVFLIGPAHPYLLRLSTDGQSFVIPRNQYAALARTAQGSLAIPAGGPYRGIYWLPCTIQSLLRPLDFGQTDPVAAFDDVGFEPELGRYLERRGNRVYVTHGIELDQARPLLFGAPPDSYYPNCASE